MPAKASSPAFDPAQSLLTALATNNRIDEYLIRGVPESAWRAKQPGGKGRDIASMVAHIHNVRLMWIKAIDKNLALPDKLDGETVTPEQAIAALNESHTALETLIARALRGDGKIKGFKPDVGSFLAYFFAHEGHHRGQITMLARQAGHPVSQSVMFGLWEWGTR
jgi:uncharacterized damage-inducible protein DinB